MVSIESLQGLFTGIIISAIVALCSSLFVGYFFQRLQYDQQLKLFEIQTKYSRDMVLKTDVINFLKESKKISTIFLILHILLFVLVFIGIFLTWQLLIGIPTSSLVATNSTCLNQDVLLYQNITNVTNNYNITVNEISFDRKSSVVSVEELKYLIVQKSPTV